MGHTDKSKVYAALNIYWVMMIFIHARNTLEQNDPYFKIASDLNVLNELISDS